MGNDIWGRCPTCDRWFYCAGWFDRDVPQPVCPVCGLEPVEIPNTASAAARKEEQPWPHRRAV